MQNDKELLALLERTPERGMEEIVAQYTGTLCAVAARRVSDREEVKDLVNETFLEFYEHRQRFDPDKGSLSAYLSTIADRLAVKRYWELSRMSAAPAEEADTRDCVADAELRSDLDAALEQLDPVDAQIVRQKYYGGMSFKEIAASLALPYETVKKRHQRSLKKLRRALAIGLLLAALAAILAACAYLVLRHFDIIPGYGINTNAETPVYVLEKEAVLETADYTLAVEDGWWNDGLLLLEYTLEGADDVTPWTISSHCGLSLSLEGLEDAELLSNTSRMLDGTHEKLTQCFFSALPPDVGDTLALRLVGAGEPLELTLRRAEETGYEHAGAFVLTENEGGLLAVPRREDGQLIVSIYPLSEGEFAIDPGLTKLFEETAPVTVTAADGTELVGTPVDYRPYSSAQYFDWSFGPAPAGEYTLNVPYVYESLAACASSTGVSGQAEPIPFTLSVPELTETTVAFPCGSVTLTPGELITDYDPLPAVDTPEVAAMRAVYADFTWQSLTIELSCTDEAREIVNLSLTTEGREGIVVSVGETALNVATENLTVLPKAVIDEASGVTVSRPGDARLGWHESVTEIPCQLDPRGLYYRWDHPFAISFTVE